MPEAYYRVRTYVKPPIPDIPGHELKPDPAKARDVVEFMAALRRLREWAGNDSLRELSRRCGGAPSHSTFGKMLRSTALPQSEDLVTALVGALGLSGDAAAWREAWRRLNVERRVHG